MKPLFFLATIFALLTVPAQAQRQTQELTSDWKFTRSDAGLTAPTTAWETVTIPHTWNNLDGQDGPPPGSDPKLGQQRGDYYRGIGWYARTLDIPADWKGRRIFLRFGAVASVAKPFLNGHPLGEHRQPFTAFCYEITPFVKFGGPNELRVQVDNSRFEDIPPLAGDFNVHGGIYRDVQLIATDAVCISPLDHASPGVTVTVKSLAKAAATVDVGVLVSNGASKAVRVRAEVEIRDAAGQSVAKIGTELPIAAATATPLNQAIELANPRRWNGVKDPYLYTIVARLLRDGKLVDEVTQPLGVRTVAITNEKGFLLNGEPYPVHGVNRHQERQDQGWALTAADDEEDLRIIREMGATAVRLAHYPQSSRVHDICDRLGLLVWDEVPFVNEVPKLGDATKATGEKTPAFDAHLELEMREMILQLRNHPSVAWWGLFNELRTVHSRVALPLVKRLNDIAHELDATRPTVGASDRIKLPTNTVPDWMAYNVYPGWYRASGDDMTKLIDERYADRGNQRIGISEYGAGANPAQHEEGEVKKPKDNGPWHPEEWQALVHERDWAALMDNPKLWGTFIWVMFDFASDWRMEGSQPGINDKGIVSHDRKIKKDAYFFYQANWTDAPMVHITSSRATPRKNAMTEVKVYSNCESVTLLVNGKSLGASKPDSLHIVRWKDVPLLPGRNHIEAIGQSNEKNVTDSCEWELHP